MEKLTPLIRSINPDLKKVIVQSSAIELVDRMDRGEVTSLQIVLTFIERCATLGIKNNYLID